MTPNYSDTILTGHFLSRVYERAPGIKGDIMHLLAEAQPVMTAFARSHGRESCHAQIPPDGPWVVFQTGSRGKLVLVTVTINRPSGHHLNLAPLWA